MFNPISEMFEMLRVKEDFERAVEHNLVMDFEEYVRRFGCEFDGKGGENEHELPCAPFVYVGEKYAGGVYEAGQIVCDSCTIGHDDIVSVWGQDSPFGYPMLTVNDEDCEDGWVWLCLEYVDRAAETHEFPVEMTRQVYLNRSTGEFRWCR